MNKKIESLGCIPFKDFLLLLNLPLTIEINIPDFISYTVLPKSCNRENKLSISEILKYCIEYCIKKDINNVITQGFKYLNEQLCIVGPNNVVSKLLTFEELLKHLGDELFIDIIINCRLFVEMPGKDDMSNLLMISGTFNSEKNTRRINRHKLFFKNKDIIQIHPKDLLLECRYKDIINEEVFEKSAIKYKKNNFSKLFYKYMTADNLIDPLKLINFLFCVSKKVFLNIFDRYNFRILKQKLTLLIYKNKLESFSEEELIRHFRIVNFRFFKNNGNIYSNIDYTNMVDFTKKYLVFLFSDFYIPFINKFVYCTESCQTKYKCYYYVRHRWYKFSETCINAHLSSDRYKSYSINDKNKCINNVRVIPKLLEGRVIVNLSSYSNLNISNNYISSIYEIIKYENRQLLSNSMLGFEDMENKLYPLINKKNLYILKMDVKKCFDNIKHNYLERLIDKLFKKDYYVVRTFSELVVKNYNNLLKINNNFLRPTKTKCITVFNEFLEYPEYFKKFSEKILLDDIYVKEYTRDEMVKIVKRVLLNNKISYKNQIFKQTEGIPQGSILSSLICALYYSQLDKKYFNKVMKDGQIIRFVDDFLVISENKSDILNFLKISKKLSKFGVTFQTKKTESNFDVTEENDLILKDSEIIYLGMKFTTIGKNTFLKNNLDDKNIKFGIYSPSNNIGLLIIKKMSKFIDTRSCILINKLNPKVYENIYDTLVLYVWKLQILFKRAIFVNENFYLRLINFGVKKLYFLCKKRDIKISRTVLSKMCSNIIDRYKM